jgi:acyl-CoA reductase-like NAD-dependent aldehyde dehydrogenase
MQYVGQKLNAGIVWCNTYNVYSPNVPVGGFKMSGYGREFGEEALEGCTHTKSIYYEMNPSDGLDW